MAISVAPSEVPVEIRPAAGVLRDGTLFNGENYNDAQWCRWYQGLPRKIGGYRRLTNQLGDIPRGMYVFDQNNETYVHVGSGTYLEQMRVDPTGVTSATVNRTPVAYTADADNMWQQDAVYDGSGTQMALVAHAAPNLLDISSDTQGAIYYGDITDTAVLAPTTATTVSGGVCVSQPYIFGYGSNGQVIWSDPNTATAWNGAARISASKIVKGMPLRAGAGNGPSTLFWSLNEVIRATFVGSTPVFNFETITSQSSILSSQGVVEYDGIFFWPAVDRFLAFNGVVREVPNTMNLNYFFDNINMTYRQKVFGFKVPRWGEIWWCYPRGDATECTHAIIYNVRENTWYDTELPIDKWSSAAYAQVFMSPMAASSALNNVGLYDLWQLEFQKNRIVGSQILAIDSNFTTPEYCWSEQGSLKSINCKIIEPDFEQTGDMTFESVGRYNARSPQQVGEQYTFPEPSATISSEDTILTVSENYRLLALKFGSNVVDGDYQMGKVLAHFQEGDERIRP